MGVVDGALGELFMQAAFVGVDCTGYRECGFTCRSPLFGDSILFGSYSSRKVRARNTADGQSLGSVCQAIYISALSIPLDKIGHNLKG